MFDCQRCGACCCNTNENRAEAYPWYVEVEGGARLFKRADLVRRYVVRDPGGVPHVRLDDDGRCTALVGELGRDVACAIYELRPRGCRRVEPGSRSCLRARQERGVG